jgi:signal transduction histidine kinase
MPETQPDPQQGCSQEVAELQEWKLDGLRQNLEYAFGLHGFAAVVLLAMVWDEARPRAVLIWSCYFCLTFAAGLWVSLRATGAARTYTDPRRSLDLFCAATVIWSSSWPLAYATLMPTPATAQLILLALLLGLSAAIAQSFGIHFPLVAAYAFCTLLPLGLVFLSMDNHFLVGAVLQLFLPAYAYLCFRTNKRAVEACKQRQQREKTVRMLKQQINRETAARGRTEKALALAEEACLNKTRFLAAASHDLRQPVHAISLFVAALKSEPFESRSRYLVDRLDRSLAGLDDLFNRLLDISRLDTGVIVPNARPFDAQWIAQTLETRFVSLANSRSLELRVHCPPGIVLRSDPELLMELVMNLLSNALLFTRRGGVLLAFRKREKSVLVQVWDTGCGISGNSIDLIFDEFVQLNNSSRDRRKGLGLGLAIVKRLSAMLGHRIGVRSRPGRGSVFEVEVERVEDSSAAPFPIAEAYSTGDALRGTLVLVVDDEIDILAAMEAVLASWGCFTILARSVEEALKFVGSSPRFPDVLITDHRLEGHKTGFDVIDEVNAALPYPIPAIVISGESTPSLESTVTATGALFMHKPVSAPRLYGAINQALASMPPAMAIVA